MLLWQSIMLVPILSVYYNLQLAQWPKFYMKIVDCVTVAVQILKLCKF